MSKEILNQTNEARINIGLVCGIASLLVLLSGCKNEMIPNPSQPATTPKVFTDEDLKKSNNAIIPNCEGVDSPNNCNFLNSQTLSSKNFSDAFPQLQTQSGSGSQNLARIFRSSNPVGPDIVCDENGKKNFPDKLIKCNPNLYLVDYMPNGDIIVNYANKIYKLSQNSNQFETKNNVQKKEQKNIIRESPENLKYQPSKPKPIPIPG